MFRNFFQPLPANQNTFAAFVIRQKQKRRPTNVE